MDTSYRRFDAGRRKRKSDDVALRFEHLRPCRRAKWRNSTADPQARPWTYSSRDFSSAQERFVIVSYNLLGVENAEKHRYLYDRVSSQYLNWDHRKKKIHNELYSYTPSILCFQEVDQFHELNDLLQQDGYIGIFKGRSGEANDGCAIFWKEKEFALLHQEDIEYRKFGLRENVAQLCVLKTSSFCLDASVCGGVNSQDAESSHRTLLVCNIHVLFNPNRGDIKLGQVRLLLERAHMLSKKWGNCPVVICGDLNSTPQSAVYQYFSSSELDILKFDRRRVSGQIEFSSNRMLFSRDCNTGRSKLHLANLVTYRWSREEICLAAGRGECTRILNPMKLFSAYCGVPGNCKTRDSNGEPLVTSYHSKFMETVDYIWHSCSLSPVRVVETLPIHILEKFGGLPSKKWGSDHFALVCEFAFLDDG